MLLAVGMLLIIVVLVKPAEAAFPGKNGKIAYVGHDGNDSEIYTINPEGGGKVQVTNNTTFEISPSYSPDGTKIAFASSDGQDDEIYTINAEGGERVQVTDNHINDTDPDYSPDGNRIALTGCEAGFVEVGTGKDCEIYTINADGGGGGRVQVTENTTSDGLPSWGAVRREAPPSAPREA